MDLCVDLESTTSQVNAAFDMLVFSRQFIDVLKYHGRLFFLSADRTLKSSWSSDIRRRHCGRIV